MKVHTKRELQIRFVILSLTALILIQSIIVFTSIHHSYTEMVQKSDLILSQLYETPSANVRYFSVRLHPGKGTARPDVVQHVSVTPEEAGTYAKNALKTGKDRGFLDGYRFHILRNETGVRILFLSRESSIEMYRTAAKNLIGISIAGILVMGIVFCFVSGWVVTPLLENQRKQKQFITAASHELKTPLTVISTNAQMLQTEIGDNPWINGILQQTEHLTQMTNNLITLAKAEEHGNQYAQETLCLPRVVQDVLFPYYALAQKKNIQLSTDISSDFTYCGDKKAIQQLVCILLDNACKYCPYNGNICVTLKQMVGGGHLSVRNSTQNLSGADISALTQRFYRGENASGVEGFGLGLSIAQSIALHHNGKLTVSLCNDTEFLVEVTLR